MSATTYAILIVTVWNAITFIIYGVDKRKAIKGKWRISENTLLLCTFLMGGTGALFGMGVFRHKTRHWKFKICVPLAVLLNATVIVLARINCGADI